MGLDDAIGLSGRLRIWERPAGTRLWRPRGEAENIVLNAYYDQVFNLMAGVISPSLTVGSMALGIQPAAVQPAPARTDTALFREWTTGITVLTAGAASGATSLTVEALPLALVSGDVLSMPGTSNVTVGAAGAAAGATAIPISATSGIVANGALVTFSNIAVHVPQRLPTVAAAPGFSDPPNVVFSFYLPAATNTRAITFSEAALLLNGSSATPGDIGLTTLLTHAGATTTGLPYTKPVNSDARFDYTLTRILT